MKIGRITGTVTATVKDPKLSGVALLIADVEDGRGNVMEQSLVVADTCSAGVGDVVLLVTGSAARLPAKVGGLPIDMAAVAIVDHVDIAASSNNTPSSNRRNK